MSMGEITEEQIPVIFKYFQRIKGARYSDWVVEMRRQISNQLIDQGLNQHRVAKVICVSGSMPVFYKKMSPRPDCKEVIDQFLWEWINNELYPKSTYKRFQGRNNQYSELNYEIRTVDDMHERQKWVPNPIRLGVNLDKIVDKL